MTRTLRLATRGSALALVQANTVKDALEALGASVEIVPVSTKGDRDVKSPLAKIGGRGLFVKEVEQVLLDGKADLAVHSGKDLPYALADGLVIAGVPKAAAPGDVLLFRNGERRAASLAAPCEEPLVIGTGSPRRVMECRQFFLNATFTELRGNVDTRLDKLRNRQYDAILAARAGLDRLAADLSDFECLSFSPDEFLPAPCQGILAVECRADDPEVIALLGRISDPESAARFSAERTMFALLQADCTVPLGVHCELFETDGRTGYRISAMYQDRKTTREGTELASLCESIRQELMS